MASDPPPDILVVCTANQCRSPLAEAILSQLLAERGVAARVHSAGLYEGGWPATADARAIAAQAGLDLSGHRSRRVTPDLVRAADLIITMARSHAREVMVLAPDAWERMFPLKDLVRRAEVAGGRGAGQSMAAWLATLGAGRARSSLLDRDPDDDIADPVGLGMDAYRRTHRELDDLLGRLAPLLAPRAPST